MAKLPLRIILYQVPTARVARCISCHNRVRLTTVLAGPSLSWCDRCRRRATSETRGSGAVEEAARDTTRCVSCHNRVGIAMVMVNDFSPWCSRCRPLTVVSGQR